MQHCNDVTYTHFAKYSGKYYRKLRYEKHIKNILECKQKILRFHNYRYYLFNYSRFSAH